MAAPTGQRSFPEKLLTSRDGVVRVIADVTSFRGVADTAFNQIRQNGKASPAVLIRMLEGLAAIMPIMTSREQAAVLEEHPPLILEEGEPNLTGPGS